MIATALTAQDPPAIGPYRLLGLLGEGGMGRVYLATSPGSRLVALKVVLPEYADDPGFRARFRREVRAAQQVSGFYTTAVLAGDADGPQPWLATAYVPAPSLREAVDRFGPVPGEPALRALGAGLAEALGAIHDVGLVHRDLKPGNVLVTADGPRVIDFGISKSVDATQVTKAGGILGTPGYMAPEQVASGREIGPASDVFALGCVLVFAATGQNPFGAGDTPKLLYRVVHDRPNLDGVPAPLRPLVADCLTKDPATRPTVTDLLAAFAPADPAALLGPGLAAELAWREQEANSIMSRPLPPPPRPPGPNRRRVLGIAAGAVGAAALGGGAIALIETRGDATGAPRLAWTRTAPRGRSGAAIHLAGDTLIWWSSTAAFGLDARSGSPRWTAAPHLPADGVPQTLTWLGMFGSTLYGTASTTSRDRVLLLGLDAAGRQRFLFPTPAPPEPFGLLDGVGGGVAIAHAIALKTDIVAVDITNGDPLWTRPVPGEDATDAITDGRLCYVQEGTSTYGLNLRTGKPSWTARNTSSPGSDAGVVVSGGVVIVVGDRLNALDAATGRRRWSAIEDAGDLSIDVAGNRVYVADTQGRHWALDARTGAQVWSAPSPPGSIANRNMSASATLLAVSLSGEQPGVLVRRAATGELLWVHRAAGSGTTWKVRAASDTVYASSSTSLWAFRVR